jgi:hypothetical protein
LTGLTVPFALNLGIANAIRKGIPSFLLTTEQTSA